MVAIILKDILKQLVAKAISYKWKKIIQSTVGGSGILFFAVNRNSKTIMLMMTFLFALLGFVMLSYRMSNGIHDEEDAIRSRKRIGRIEVK